MKNLIKAAAVAALFATALPATPASAAMPVPAPIVSEGTKLVQKVHQRRFKHRHRRSSSRASHGFRGTVRKPRHKSQFYRAFDRARLYTDGPATGPSGYRKLRPEFRDGRAYRLFGK